MDSKSSDKQSNSNILRSKEMAKTKTGISINPKILDNLDAEAERLDMSRSEFIEALMADYIESRINGDLPLLSYDVRLTQSHALYTKGILKYEQMNNKYGIEEYKM